MYMCIVLVYLGLEWIFLILFKFVIVVENFICVLLFFCFKMWYVLVICIKCFLDM